MRKPAFSKNVQMSVQINPKRLLFATLGAFESRLFLFTDIHYQSAVHSWQQFPYSMQTQYPPKVTTKRGVN